MRGCNSSAAPCPARQRGEKSAAENGAATPTARRAAESARPTPTPRANLKGRQAGSRRSDRSLLLCRFRFRFRFRFGLFELLDADRNDLDLNLGHDVLVQAHFDIMDAESLDRS